MTLKIAHYRLKLKGQGWELLAAWHTQIFTNKIIYSVLIDCSHIQIYGLSEYITMTEQTNLKKKYPASTRQIIISKIKWERVSQVFHRSSLNLVQKASKSVPSKVHKYRVAIYRSFLPDRLNMSGLKYSSLHHKQ